MITLLLMLIACGNDTNEATTTETTQQTQNVEATTPEVKKPITTPANTNAPKTTVENNSTDTVNGNTTETNENTKTEGEDNATITND